jgi:hypothetical protein
VAHGAGDVDRVQEFRKCIECFLCQDVCHVLRDHDKHDEFIGPRFFVYAAALEMHPLDTEDRVADLKDATASATATSPSAARRSAPSTSPSPTTRSSRSRSASSIGSTTRGRAFSAGDWLREAMEQYELAEDQRPPGNDEARLRWNACARVLNAHPELAAAEHERTAPLMLE